MTDYVNPHDEPIDESQVDWIGMGKLSRDLLKASANLTRADARVLIELYYLQQRQRIRVANQLAETRRRDPEKSTELLEWTVNNQKIFERNCLVGLTSWANQHEIVDRWAGNLYAVGPIICASMLAHLDEDPPRTCGKWWAYAGLVPNLKQMSAQGAQRHIKSLTNADSGRLDREQIIAVCDSLTRNLPSIMRFAAYDAKGKRRPITVASVSAALARRPWNARLKTLLWKFASVQVRLYKRNPDRCHYGELYYRRRAYEQARNDAGELAEQAAEALATKTYGKSTEAYKHYSAGRLPPLHIHARCLRWVEKVFVAHWHHIAWVLKHNTLPPRPWIIEHGGHEHYIPPPDWEDPPHLLPDEDPPGWQDLDEHVFEWLDDKKENDHADDDLA